MAAARRSTIYLEPDLHRRLRRIGAEEERTVSELVNSAVAAFLDAPPAGATARPGASPASSADHPVEDAEGTSASPAVIAGRHDAGNGRITGEMHEVGTFPTAPEAPAALVAPGPELLPAFALPPATMPEGLAPPIRRLFGALRPVDADQQRLRAVAATRAGA
ncbi:MAG: hypothetical protein MUF21_02360 [Gemmatimonadaceae bacterium]|nr:hypothetical protein [Gemmatimonadaceae bacterium]